MQLGLAEAGKDEVAGAECRGGVQVMLLHARCRGGCRCSWGTLQHMPWCVATAAREGGSSCKGRWQQLQGRVAAGAREGG